MRDVTYVVAVIEMALSRFHCAGGGRPLAEMLAGDATSAAVVVPDISNHPYRIFCPFPPLKPDG